MRVLVTGFTPFGKHRSNPTERLAREADGRRVGGALLAGRVLPTEFRGCDRALDSALRETRPDAVLMFGLDGRRKRLALECVALNVDHAEKPDNAGRQPWRRPIDPRGPTVVESTLPVDRLHSALRRAGMAVAVSYHAGTYVCNHAFYRAVRRAGRARVGFIHVPKTISPRRLRRALTILVRLLARRGNMH
ncbi:MAG TPA: pyroglutamyl-peptidase I [Planctomycetota bacterium]|jgi:pyroglutamyl-peptidase|nr:pyroglutamyl-peptidase I [Planctomycetota bacterium]